MEEVKIHRKELKPGKPQLNYCDKSVMVCSSLAHGVLDLPTILTLSHTTNIYSQSCIKRPRWGQGKIGRLRKWSLNKSAPMCVCVCVLGGGGEGQVLNYSLAAIIQAPLDQKCHDMGRNTRGWICPVQFSLFNPEICVPEPERKLQERRVKKQYKLHHVNRTWSDGQISNCFHR